ncbi:MAG: hypothetical protein C0497_02860 [Gemmatimonas sp.]|nr:hypothetical protein [Gemmatimonas sp.]
MDSTRRVLEDGTVAIQGDRIIAVGSAREMAARFTSRETINAHRKVVMPGLIDGHGHAGHGLVKTLGMDTDDPSAVAAMRERFTLVELLEAGATVMLGSDGVAPDRSYDMFRHMFQAMRYHRTAFRDPSVLPAGKVLEMVTIDAARALGMERDVGSLEPGKKADIILVDLFRPHMVPMNMPLYRVAYFANGNDVSTVLVNGRVLMRDRQVLSVNEEDVLNFAQREAEAAIMRAGLAKLKETPEGFWGRSWLPKR